jgi:hypothetical protein
MKASKNQIKKNIYNLLSVSKNQSDIGRLNGDCGKVVGSSVPANDFST